jgi:hypothetical protein
LLSWIWLRRSTNDALTFSVASDSVSTGANCGVDDAAVGPASATYGASIVTFVPSG